MIEILRLLSSKKAELTNNSLIILAKIVMNKKKNLFGVKSIIETKHVLVKVHVKSNTFTFDVKY